MEYQKNLLGSISDKVPKFITKKWIEVHNQSGNAENRYKPSKQIKFKTSMLQSDLCDFSDAYIVVKGTIIAVENPNNDANNKKLVFKNNASFISCITKNNNTPTDNTENLVIVMPMYNLVEYSKNYSKTSGSLWDYYRDKPNSGTEGNINYSIKGSKSFDYKTSITGKLEGNTVENESVEIVVPLKYLSNFWRSLEIPLINCEISLTLTWSENCVITGKATRDADPDADSAVAEIDNPTKATFKGCVGYIFASLFLDLNESTCQTRENVFYFTSKVLFVLDKIKCQNSTFSNFMTSSNA